MLHDLVTFVEKPYFWWVRC